MIQFAISFAAFCTAGQKRNKSTTRHIEAAQQWCKCYDYTLEQYPEREDMDIAAFSGSSVTLGCLYLVRHRLERGYITRGTVLILETLNGVPRDAWPSVITVLMDLMQHGLALVTLRDGKLWNPAAVEDFCQFMISVVSMLCDDLDSVSCEPNREVPQATDTKARTRKGLLASCYGG